MMIERQFTMKIAVIIKLAIILCLLIDNVPVSGHQTCLLQAVQVKIKTKSCGVQNVDTIGCRGHCASSSRPLLGQQRFAVTCYCCRPIKQKMKRHVVCTSPREEVRLPSARKCACRACSHI